MKSADRERGGDPAAVLKFFQHAAARSAQLPRQAVVSGAHSLGGEEGVVSGAFGSVEGEEHAIEVDIKGFYTLDASLSACARVPLSPQEGAGVGVGRSAGMAVQGVDKAALVQHLSAESKALLLGDRYFPDALVPSSLLQFATLLQTPQVSSKGLCAGMMRRGSRVDGEGLADGPIWSLDRLRLLAKARCGISSPSLFHHALDLVHATGHALVLPCSFSLPCALGEDVQGGRRPFARSQDDVRERGHLILGHAGSLDEEDESGESGRWEVGVGGRCYGGNCDVDSVAGAADSGFRDSGVVVLSSTSIGWISQASAVVVSLSRAVACLLPPPSPHVQQPELASVQGIAAPHQDLKDLKDAHLSSWSLLVAALRPVLGLQESRTDCAPRRSSWGRSSARPSPEDVRARQMVEELQKCDADACGLRRGLLLPAVASLLLSRPGCPHWCVTAQILVRCVCVCVSFWLSGCLAVCLSCCAWSAWIWPEYRTPYSRLPTTPRNNRHVKGCWCYPPARLQVQEAFQEGSGWEPPTCPCSASMCLLPHVRWALCLPADSARWCRR